MQRTLPSRSMMRSISPPSGAAEFAFCPPFGEVAIPYHRSMQGVGGSDDFSDHVPCSYWGTQFENLPVSRCESSFLEGHPFPAGKLEMTAVQTDVLADPELEAFPAAPGQLPVEATLRMKKA